MAVRQEAVVETNETTYRAVYLSPGVVGISEDGKEGLQDQIRLDDSELSPSDQLAHVLVVWIYEMRRGLDIRTVTLQHHTIPQA